MQVQPTTSSWILWTLILACFLYSGKPGPETSWIRINQLGYLPGGLKSAVWCSKNKSAPIDFELVDAATGKTAFRAKAGRDFGAYGPFTSGSRLNFSSFKTPGRYFLRTGTTCSPEFRISDTVYQGTADFCLRYMRQQRSGFNPFLKDSCHTHDGYTLYGSAAGLPDSSFIDVTGGWHDASDYLQYASTSANAAYHLLMAWRDFPRAFGDQKAANGLDGRNGVPDVLDEARWGIDWLIKMHPSPGWMFNQVADDRDHINMRLPAQDTQYGRGFQRPVYFVTGEPQQRGKGMNHTTGTSSIAAKFSSAFALASAVFMQADTAYASLLRSKSVSAWRYALKKPGVTQTASVRAPYIYAEENWVDDMELAATWQQQYGEAFRFARKEKQTPWLASDTAAHYQWYPFINLGHAELAQRLQGDKRDSLLGFYREGIRQVWNRASTNAFYRGVPYIWCSNNLTVAFAMQCYWYRKLSGSREFEELEQANTDWLFGCNPWGTSMVYGLPASGDTPVDPHSAFTHIGKFPIDGGLVDGPVYTSIYRNLIGITLFNEDMYAAFQSPLAVYHDDYGDYSTNEPTMDGTASLIYLLAAIDQEKTP
jgi:hypothetical protein